MIRGLQRFSNSVVLNETVNISYQRYQRLAKKNNKYARHTLSRLVRETQKRERRERERVAVMLSVRLQHRPHCYTPWVHIHRL